MTKYQVKQTLLREGFPASSIDSFLSMIDLPEGGNGLDRMQNYLPDLLHKVESFGRYYMDFKFDRQLAEMATTLSLLMQPPVAVTCKDKRRSPLWGLFGTNAVYVAIWTVLQDPRDRDTAAYVELLAHVVIAASIIRKKAEKNAEYRNVLVTAPGALRKAFEAVTTLSGIQLDCPPTNLRKNIQNSSLAEALTPVCTLLSYVYSRTAPRREGGERRTTTCRHRMISCKYDDLGFDEEQRQGTTQITLISRHREEPDKEEMLLAEGEISHYPDMIAASEPRQQLQSLTQQILHAQRAARTALTNRNQALPHHWQGLTQHEIMRLWHAIDWLSCNSSNAKTANPNDTLATTMAAMLLCGKSVDEAAGMMIYHGNPPVHPRPGLLHRNGQWYWVSVPYSVDDSDESQKGTCLIFPLPQRANAVFHCCASSSSNTISALADNSALQTDIQTIISAINHRYRTRLTMERISHYLFELIQKQEGADVSTAMYLTGQSAYLGTVVSHYTRLSGNRLALIYRAVWEGILSERPTDIAEENLPQNPDIGSSRVPRRKTVQSLVVQLKEKIHRYQESYNNDNDYRNLIKYHNALTRYTAIYIAYATGIRAVTYPFPDDENIDHETGFCVISDKDSDDNYHTRLIWLPPDCHRQYRLYRDHSRIVAATMANIRNDFFARVKDRFFFLDENGSPAAISPKRLYDFSDLPTPISIAENGNRHMLRSWLLFREVQPEIINAYLGHWFLGEEPWAQHSALSPYQYRLSLSTHVQELLDHLGFEPVNGVAKND